jgi:hypothetical protein
LIFETILQAGVLITAVFNLPLLRSGMTGERLDGRGMSLLDSRKPTSEKGVHARSCKLLYWEAWSHAVSVTSSINYAPYMAKRAKRQYMGPSLKP